MRRHCLIYLIWLACLTAVAPGIRAQVSVAPFCTDQTSPKTELRAVWLTTIGGIDWPRSHNAREQQAELCTILDRLKAAGINTILLQTRVRGTTVYPSAFEPWDRCLTGIDGKHPGYDPLQFAIDECHSRGMQLHAWVVTIPIGKWKGAGCTQLRKKKPQLVSKIGDEGYMNPEKESTADYLAAICSEITRHYDIDGIHLDYIRYPETWKMRVSNAKGRENITRIVDRIYRQVKVLKPWVMVSCSPIGKHDDLLRYSAEGWNARTRVCQDAQRWLKDGIMDALFPMMYFRDNHFFPFAIDWQEHDYGRLVVPGLGIYFLDPKEGRWAISDVVRQMHVTRQLGMGHCYFRSRFLTDNHQGIYDFARHFNRLPALIPPMTWLTAQKPPQPQNLELRDGLLSWTQDSLSDNSGAPCYATARDSLTYIIYNVYASKDYPVDISKAENLVATRLRVQQLHVQQGLFYAVTAQDRYGQESEALQMTVTLPPTDKKKELRIPISTTGIIDMPSKGSILDADYLIVETLQGRTAAILPYRGRQMDVSSLPDGIYRLRSLGKKGRNHPMGYFSLKRTKLY